MRVTARAPNLAHHDHSGANLAEDEHLPYARRQIYQELFAERQICAIDLGHTSAPSPSVILLEGPTPNGTFLRFGVWDLASGVPPGSNAPRSTHNPQQSWLSDELGLAHRLRSGPHERSA